jgi:hypothetical protein
MNSVTRGVARWLFSFTRWGGKTTLMKARERKNQVFKQSSLRIGLESFSKKVLIYRMSQ